MYKIDHLLSEPHKVSKFNNDKDFIDFTNLIANENDDSEFILDTVDKCINYINVYCDNLKLI